MRKNSSFTWPAWKRCIRKEIRAAGRVLVLGIGNPAKGDDAAGLVCAKKLKALIRGQARSRLKILLGYEAPENLTGKIRMFDPDVVLILDAAQGPFAPGTVFFVGKGKIQDEGVSTHKISLALLVSYLEETIGCKVIVLGIQPQVLALGENLSAPVEKAAGKLAAYFAHVLTGKSA